MMIEGESVSPFVPYRTWLLRTGVTPAGAGE